MKEILDRLAKQEYFSRKEAHDILIKITEEKFSDMQIAALLMGLKTRGITTDEILGLRDGVLETGTPIDLSPFEPIDIVGTGGDGKDTFNISTASCFVVAAAGYKVAKHGNYASSSVSGASNVLEAHGIGFVKEADKLRTILDKVGIVYLHAPLFALGMKYVGPARRALQVPTCFNILGPLVNPSRPKHQLLGVATLEQMRLYQHIYQKVDAQYGIAHSLDGYDEISLTGQFKVITNTSERIYSPEQLGLKKLAQEELYGGATINDAVKVFDSVLQCTSTEARMQVVEANAAFAIQVIEQSKTFEECLAIAHDALRSGKAWDKFCTYVETVKKLS